MKRVIFGLVAPFVALLALGLTTGTRASAAVEFCPATAGAFHPLDGKNAAALYSFTLKAYSARHVTADVAVQTNTGWYDVQVPSTALVPRVQTWQGPAAEFKRRTFSSDALYVRFPSAVKVLGAFVRSAAAPDDTLFGWADRGTFMCQAPAGFGAPAPQDAYQSNDINGTSVHLLNPRTDLDRMPSAQAPVIVATSMPAPGTTDCPTPSTPITVKRTVQPLLPEGYTVSHRAWTDIRVAVGADGTLEDAGIWVPSDNTNFNKAALQAVTLSTFSPGSSFCEPAPGTRIVRVYYNF